MQSYQLTLPEAAGEWVERALAETCPVHVYTTLDGGQCEVCLLEQETMRRPQPQWVTRAIEGTLPTKEYR